MATEIPEIFRELQRFRSAAPSNTYRGKEANIFWSVDEAEILAAEQRMGIAFPPQLRLFYQHVGHGKLTEAKSGLGRIYDPNAVLSPDEAASGYLRDTPEIKIWPELWEEGELPFFNYLNASCLVLRPQNAGSETVYRSGRDDAVAPDFVAFLERLYEDVTFYLGPDPEDEGA